MWQLGVRKCESSVDYNALEEWVTKCDRLLESVTKRITKCIRDYKMCQGRLQGVAGITECDGIPKIGGAAYYIQVKM